MRRIGIVGAGQAGLQMGIGLLAHGYEVTLYSERSAEETLASRLTATAFLFHRALGYERDLGLNFWDGEVEHGEGIHLDYCPTPRNRLLAVQGRFKAPGMAVDQRLKFSRWMDELEKRGGRLVIRHMGVADVDAAAAEHDLMVVATGKGELSTLFERDSSRSVHSRPQRKLALVTVRGLERWSEIPFHVAKFTLVGSDGELFWIPFHDKDGVSCHSLVFEAKAGLRMDRFDAAQSGEEVIAIARQIVADLAPWELHRLANVELADPLAWAKGAITPVVRRPVAHLPSGRLAVGLGDAVVLNDPIAAQGANHAAKSAHFMTGQIVERGDRPFDAAWMEAAFDDFWHREAHCMSRFTNLFLEPITAPAKEILLAASRVPSISEEFFEGFNEPHTLWPWIEDLGQVRRRIAQRTGRPWVRTAAAARFAVLRGQVGQRLTRATPAATPLLPAPAQLHSAAPPLLPAAAQLHSATPQLLPAASQLLPAASQRLDASPSLLSQGGLEPAES